MIVCWCDFVAWTKKRNKTENEAGEEGDKDKYIMLIFLCWRKMKMAFDSTWLRVKLGEENEQKKFCRWRILSRFLHCLWTFYGVFHLFVRSFVRLFVCTFARVWHAKRNVDYFCRIYRSFRSRLNLLFAWIFDWTNLSFGSLACSLFLLFAE